MPSYPLNSLVLYKTHPARVLKTGDKLEIALQSGKTQKIRPKDVILLHPGPLHSLSELTTQQGEDVELVRELLDGETTTLPDLAELIYGDFTPATAWAAWQLLADGLYFSGTPDAIQARPADEVAREQAARQAKNAERQAWASFLERLDAGKISPEDHHYLKDVEQLALGQSLKSRVLRYLKRSETPENAHALLLKLKYWDYSQNPYPVRLGLTTSPPQASLLKLSSEDRADLTHLPAFAIDDAGSTDPDDALSLEGDRLWVHVADVAALVPPNSAADNEARTRGANIYLPEGTLHMLPAAATEALALGLAERSPALSFGLDLDEAGNVVNLEITPSWINVQRFSYAEVETLLADPPFHRLHQLAVRNQARRRQNASVEIDLPEVKVYVADGQVEINPIPPLRSRNLVKEAMLLCGEAVAQYARNKDIPLPYSTQPPPGDYEISDGLAGMFALRRAMQRSQLSTIPGPHAGLGLEHYVQITSPLRRYLDLVAHQQIRNHLEGKALLSVQEIMERIGAIEALGNLRQAERLSNKHWTLVYLLQNPNWEGEGVLVEKQGKRAIVLIPDLALEIRPRLPGDIPLNSHIRLRNPKVNLPELEVHFQVL